MAILINNQQQLINAMKIAINHSIDYIMKQIYEENKQLIQELVYNAYSPKDYNRTYELRDNWNYDIKDSRFSVTGEFGLDTNSMTLDMENFIHGSTISGDFREYVADKVIKGIDHPFGNRGARSIEPRDFWTPLINKLDNGKIEEWFNYQMKQEGFD